MFNILIAEDDKNTRRLLQALLKSDGYTPFLAENGLEAFDILEKQDIDLVVLDVMMPVMDGFTFTEELRAMGNTVPVLMLSAKSQPKDRIAGFRSGTDDYMTKPFEEEELLLRIQALLRRSQATTEHLLTVGEVVLDYDSLSVRRGSAPSQILPQKEFLLLYKLLSFPNKIFTRIQLMDEFWGPESDSADSTVTVHINRLRRRFEEYPEFRIVTVRGLGYKAEILTDPD